MERGGEKDHERLEELLARELQRIIWQKFYLENRLLLIGRIFNKIFLNIAQNTI